MPRSYTVDAWKNTRHSACEGMDIAKSVRAVLEQCPDAGTMKDKAALAKAGEAMKEMMKNLLAAKAKLDEKVPSNKRDADKKYKPTADLIAKWHKEGEEYVKALTTRQNDLYVAETKRKDAIAGYVKVRKAFLETLGKKHESYTKWLEGTKKYATTAAGTVKTAEASLEDKPKLLSLVTQADKLAEGAEASAKKLETEHETFQTTEFEKHRSANGTFLAPLGLDQSDADVKAADGGNFKLMTDKLATLQSLVVSVKAAAEDTRASANEAKALILDADKLADEAAKAGTQLKATATELLDRVRGIVSLAGQKDFDAVQALKVQLKDKKIKQEAYTEGLAGLKMRTKAKLEKMVGTKGKLGVVKEVIDGLQGKFDRSVPVRIRENPKVKPVVTTFDTTLKQAKEAHAAALVTCGELEKDWQAVQSA